MDEWLIQHRLGGADCSSCLISATLVQPFCKHPQLQKSYAFRPMQSLSDPQRRPDMTSSRICNPWGHRIMRIRSRMSYRGSEGSLQSPSELSGTLCCCICTCHASPSAATGDKSGTPLHWALGCRVGVPRRTCCSD